MVVPANADVNKKLATSLVGLRMKVLGSWWDNSDSSGHQLHDGKIHFIDFEENENRIFQLQLDDVDEPDLYPMRYHAVLAYADECQAGGKKEVPKDGTFQHRKKHAQLEDAYNKRW